MDDNNKYSQTLPLRVVMSSARVLLLFQERWAFLQNDNQFNYLPLLAFINKLIKCLTVGGIVRRRATVFYMRLLLSKCIYKVTRAQCVST